jgi:hypothetical protein
LERNGYEAKTALQRRSVRIDLSGTTLDVVPVVTQGADDRPLWIPDRPLAKWVTTHPKGHLSATSSLNADTNERYVPFVKIVKAWYRYQACTLGGQERPKPKGFTLEALVARHQDGDAPTYAEAFVNFLDNLWTACGSDLQQGVFPSVPDFGMAGKTIALTVSSKEAKDFGKIVHDSLEAAKKALATEGVAASAAAWAEIFGPRFPTAAAGKKSFTAAAKAVVEDDDEDEAEGEDALDEEIAKVDLPAAPTLGTLVILAELAAQENGLRKGRYPSGGRALPKGWWLRFSIAQTSVAAPYEVRWLVENHGHEAQRAGDLRHTRTGAVAWEHTAYRGSHAMTCELHRDGRVLARARHSVNAR